MAIAMSAAWAGTASAAMSIAEARQILHGLGWKIKREFYTRNTSGFLFAYSFGGVEDVVKVEVSKGVKGKAERTKAASDFLPPTMWSSFRTNPK